MTPRLFRIGGNSLFISLALGMDKHARHSLFGPFGGTRAAVDATLITHTHTHTHYNFISRMCWIGAVRDAGPKNGSCPNCFYSSARGARLEVGAGVAKKRRGMQEFPSRARAQALKPPPLSPLGFSWVASEAGMP